MKNQIAKIALFGLVAAALVAVPTAGRAGDSTNTPAQTVPKKHSQPFHGKVAAVDTAAMTVSVASLTINVTSETKITKDGKPATLSDIAVGDTVGGSFRKDDTGKLNASIIRANDKAPTGEKKKKAGPAAAPAN